MTKATLRIVTALALSALACGRDEADLLLPGYEGGGPMPPDGSVVEDAPMPDVLPPLVDVVPPLDRDAAPCLAGYAARFTPTSSLAVARPVQDDFTLEAWIKTQTSRKGSMFYHGNGVIYADAPPGSNPAGGDDFGTSILNDKFAFGIGNPDTTLQSNSTVTSGAWVHVAATRNKAAGEAHVFVNGIDENSVTTTQKGSLTEQKTLTVGCTLNDQNHFIGQMDEVRIWNVARTGAEIAATMNQRLTGQEPGLVAYWRFDDPGGVTAVDSSPAKADALISGTLEWVPSDAPLCAR